MGKITPEDKILIRRKRIAQQYILPLYSCLFVIEVYILDRKVIECPREVPLHFQVFLHRKAIIEAIEVVGADCRAA